MQVSIKKITVREGKERFVLVDSTTREVLTVHDVSEATLRGYFKERGVADDVLDGCFERARKRYEERSQDAAPAVNDSSDTVEDDDLLFELGLSENDADVH